MCTVVFSVTYRVKIFLSPTTSVETGQTAQVPKLITHPSLLPTFYDNINTSSQ